MRIETKLTLRTAVIITSLIVVGAIGFFYTRHTVDTSMSRIENEAYFILKINEVEKSAWEMLSHLTAHAGSIDLKRMQEQERRVMELQNSIAVSIADLGTKYAQAAKKNQAGRARSRQWQVFQNKWHGFDSSVQDVLSLSRDYNKEEASELVTGKGRDAFNEAADILHEGIARHEMRMETLRNDTKTARSNAARIVVSISGLIIAIALILVGRFSRKLLAPLVQTNKQLKALAKGELAQGCIDCQGNDEISEIVIAAQQLKDGIKNTIEQAEAISTGNYDTEIKLRSEHDLLGLTMKDMIDTLRTAKTGNDNQNWIKTGQTKLNDRMRGELKIVTLAKNVITFLATYIGAQAGMFYIVDKPHGREGTSRLKLLGSYAHVERKNLANEFEFGEGLVGQAALEQQSILVTQVPRDYMCIQSGLGEAVPKNILVLPFFYENAVKGVIELGTLTAFTEVQLDFLDQVMTNVGIAVHTSESRTEVHELLLQSQTQSQELQCREEELRQTNEELAERTHELERQQENIRKKNLELQKTKAATEVKAKEVEQASMYKSEFLANMSHELRTPLNSLLILAQLLMVNKEGNLNEKQVESARTIHSAGSDLLTLINDILDMSKVEAGRLELHAEIVVPADLATSIGQKFRHVAENRDISFEVTLDKDLPQMLYTDGQRLKQIINNLLSNACKFTSQGGVTLAMRRTFPDETPDGIAISVTDTGIGIPKDKLETVFDAFRQAESSTSKRFGGTGLGLSISRQLAQMLGGSLQLHSEEGKGSTFTLYLPENMPGEAPPKRMAALCTPAVAKQSAPLPPPAAKELKKPPVEKLKKTAEELKKTAEAPKQPLDAPKKSGEELPENDDRDALNPGDKSLLIIEDDRKFVNILADQARQKGFKCIVAEDGKIGLLLAKQYKPGAIILDVGLPQTDGLTVMEQLKNNPQIRHIPVHFISASDEHMDARKMGAIGYLLKPVTTDQLGEAFKKIEHFISLGTLKNLLVVAENPRHKQEITELAGGEGIDITAADSGAEVRQTLQDIAFDCIILDIDQDDGLIDWLHTNNNLSQIPIIVYAERELTGKEEAMLQRCMDSLTLKTVRSPERLLEEATLFLHQMEAKLPREKQKMLEMVHDKEAILANKKVLVVDDDMRNAFALVTSLEEKGMEVFVGQNGKEGLSLLEENQDLDLVLMDIMMPEMDGYHTIKQIRSQQAFRTLPIIALTAKAMQGDKAKCIEAGANDYLTKPVDSDKLFSVMRVWLYR